MLKAVLQETFVRWVMLLQLPTTTAAEVGVVCPCSSGWAEGHLKQKLATFPCRRWSWELAGDTGPPPYGVACPSALREPRAFLLGKVRCLKSVKLVFSRQRSEVSFKCVVRLSPRICWMLHTTLKRPGNCDWDRQSPAARRLLFVTKGTFLEKEESRLWAEKAWLLLGERHTWVIMQGVKSNFPNAQRCSALKHCSISCIQTVLNLKSN